MSDTTRTAEEISRAIEVAREKLLADVSALEQRVKETIDWRRRIRERPVQAVGAALAIGFVLGIL